MAKTAREEGFSDIAEWFETLAKAERSHASRFSRGRKSLRQGGYDSLFWLGELNRRLLWVLANRRVSWRAPACLLRGLQLTPFPYPASFSEQVPADLVAIQRELKFDDTRGSR